MNYFVYTSHNLEGVIIKKSATLTGLVLDTNMTVVSFFWETSMAAVTSCENILFKTEH